MKMNTKKWVHNMLIYVIMIAVSITMLFPFLWMVSTSLKTRKDAISIAITLIPEPVTMAAYIDVWDIVPLLSGFKNTLLVVTPQIVLGTFVSAMAAFAFAKMDIPCKKVLFMGVLSTMMIPGVINLIPQYVVWGRLGVKDSLIPLIVPGLLGNVSMMFFLRQFLNGIPNDYIGAARIDGAGWVKTFLKIFLPLMKPAIAAQVIFWFMSIWNDFLGPLVYLSSEDKFTLQLCMRLLDSLGRTTMEYPLIMAGSVLSCIPLLVIFICFQRYFMDSMVISGVKG